MNPELGAARKGLQDSWGLGLSRSRLSLPLRRPGLGDRLPHLLCCSSFSASGANSLAS